VKVSEHFTMAELACRCGCGKFNMDGLFLSFLGAVRLYYNAPMKITSGCRCTEHNARVGGAKDSAHVMGLAVDVHCDNGDDKYKLIEAAIYCGATGIGIYSSWLHLDIKPRTRQTLWHRLTRPTA